ncbi:MAG: tRNA lysidine(34) synthetase TilS [Hyphomicrobiales bacterium]|nr:tRNA lysidine(34) synthetase TilS [Hyphomicrobiales bacterium]
MLGAAAASPMAAPQDVFASLAQARGVLLAVSGGADSTALLLLAMRWRASGGAPPLFVATVDHRLRPQSADEARAVADLCAQLGAPHATLVWRGHKPKARVQEAARAARYRLLAEEAVRCGCDVVATGHHADDQAETILMRLTRGSGPAGLAGMAARAPVPGAPALALARPLLALHKMQLVALCQEAGVAFVDDPGNADEAFARGRLRRLAPLLEAEGLDGAALLRLGARARRADAALAAFAHAPRAGFVQEGGAFRAPLAEFLALPDEIGLRILAAAIMRAAPGARIRLERLEALHARLKGAPQRFRATLAGAAIASDGGLVTVRPAPPRRALR